MDEGRKIDRTWLCSVLFLDIVKYSAQSVETQIEWKRFFNNGLLEVLRAVPPDDRVILDTGDGAVVCFLGDPEAALIASLGLLNSFLTRKSTDEQAPQLRLGINLGPIRLIRDINGNLNAVGDGINVGQRIMAFADANQLLISRSYFDVVSCLTEQYKSMFRYDGVRQDKHVREHAVYALVNAMENIYASTDVETQSEDRVEDTPPKPLTAFSPQALATVERCLSSVVGPMAGRIVKAASLQTSSIVALCDAVAKSSIPEKEREVFLKACHQALGSNQPSTNAASDLPDLVAIRPVHKDWDDNLLEQLRVNLSEYLGPIAKMLIARTATKVQTREELYERLATHLTSSTERAAFLSKVRAL